MATLGLTPSKEHSGSAPMGRCTKASLAVSAVALLVAVGVVLSKSPMAPTLGSVKPASEYRMSHFPAWKHDIPLIGKMWVAEFEGCDGAIINSGPLMKQIVTDAVNHANASMVAIIYKVPALLSGLCLSHASTNMRNRSASIPCRLSSRACMG
jgi:hypothetical protein